MNTSLSLHELIRNADACQKVENLHALHCYYHSAGRNLEEVDNYWICNDRASWGHGFGRWEGWRSVKYGWGSSLERQTYGAYLELTQVWPQVTGVDPRPLYESAMHTLSTDIIEVAEDGKTARAYFYTPGTITCTLNTERRREGRWMWERYGVEYELDEDGQWKFLTIQVVPDLIIPLDIGNPAEASLESISKRDGPPVVGRGGDVVLGCAGPISPIVDDTTAIKNPWTLLSSAANPIPWPEPYETFNTKRSYRVRAEDWEDETK